MNAKTLRQYQLLGTRFHSRWSVDVDSTNNDDDDDGAQKQ